MRNYLFDRSVVTIAEQKARKRRKRRLLWLIPSFGVAVAGGVLAAILLYPRFLPPPPAEDTPSAGEQDAVQGETTPETIETTMPRAALGDGTVLTISTEEGPVLSAHELYEKVLPSVVSVQALMNEGVASASGVLMSENGYVLTNRHIVEGASRTMVFLLTTGEGYEAELVGWADDLDLAVLKIEADGLIPAEFASSRDLFVGEPVYALGNPMGYLYGSLVEGIVSGPARSIDLEGRETPMIQTSTPLSSGNSGGALLNEHGQVVGITTAKMKMDKMGVSVEGVGLALPISDIRGMINAIIEHGRVVTPRIGILCYAVEMDGVPGMMVDSATEGDPAEKAGIRPRDFISHANGIPIQDLNGLKDILYDTGVGNEVILTILRGTETIEITVTLAE